MGKLSFCPGLHRLFTKILQPYQGCLNLLHNEPPYVLSWTALFRIQLICYYFCDFFMLWTATNHRCHAVLCCPPTSGCCPKERCRMLLSSYADKQIRQTPSTTKGIEHPRLQLQMKRYCAAIPIKKMVLI